MLDALEGQSEQDLREYVLGSDRQGNQYIHFPQFCGRSLRVYRRQHVPYDPDVLYPTKKEEQDHEDETAFTKEQVKDFRKMLKNIKRVSYINN